MAQTQTRPRTPSQLPHVRVLQNSSTFESTSSANREHGATLLTSGHPSDASFKRYGSSDDLGQLASRHPSGGSLRKLGSSSDLQTGRKSERYGDFIINVGCVDADAVARWDV